MSVSRTRFDMHDRYGAGSPLRRGPFGLPAYRVETYLTVFFWLVALLLGFLQAWDGRYAAGEDDVSYLDMGDAYFRGDWVMALNGYFNPFYAWVLGLVMHLVRPTPYWEYPVVHLVIFIFYVLSLFCFSLFLKEMLRYREMRSRQGVIPSGILRPPAWVWIVLGYSVFMWSSLDLISVSNTAPDMLIATPVYLAAVFLLRIRIGSARWSTFILLGAVLGLGYLTKAVFFPLSFIFLGVGLLAVGDLRKAIPRIAISLFVFLLLAGPFILALSTAKGRFTFGDAGRLNYAWYVNGTTLRHWQGSAEDGIPSHPTRRLFRLPATYEFGSPVGGTYPVWYDASYWYEGLAIRFFPRRQIEALWRNLSTIGTYFLRLNGSLFLGAFLLALTSRRRILKDVAVYWFLIIPCLGALGIYALVTVDSRYVGPFATIIVLGVFVGIQLPDSLAAMRLVGGIAVAILVMLFLPIGPSAIPKGYSGLLEILNLRERKPNPPWQVANEVRKLGILPGDKVASVSYSKKKNVTWARLARVRIVAEVFYSPTMPVTFRNEFWRASPAVQNEVIEAFASAGAKMIISDAEPPFAPIGAASVGDWQRLGETNFYAYTLARHAASSDQMPSGD